MLKCDCAAMKLMTVKIQRYTCHQDANWCFHHIDCIRIALKSWMMLVCGCMNACTFKYIRVFDNTYINVCVHIIIIIMVIFKCYFSGELIALS